MRWQSVDALRGVAALAVMVCHAWGWFVHDNLQAQGGAWWLAFPVTLGHTGVHLFLVLSGFCIHMRWARMSEQTPGVQVQWWDFWKRRMVRLYPPYVVALLASLALSVLIEMWLNSDYTWSGMQAQQAMLPWDLLTHLLMVHLFFSAFAFGGGNGVFWTLALEEHLYVLYQPFLWLRQRLGLTGTLMVVGGVCLVWRSVCVMWLKAPPVNVAVPQGWSAQAMLWMCQAPARWLEWCLGAVAAEWVLSRRQHPVILTHPLTAIGLLVAAVLANQYPYAWIVNDIVWGLGFFVLLNALVMSENQATNQSKHHTLILKKGIGWLTACGIGSYSIYLVHLPVLQTSRYVGYHLGLQNQDWGMALLMLPAMGAALLLAWLFHHGIEKRFMHPHQHAPKQQTAEPIRISGPISNPERLAA
ncbi:MAG: acyltransferase [Phycisphaerales bacterium]|nr:acyltransferase [Phycisphaerales bacterium]